MQAIKHNQTISVYRVRSLKVESSIGRNFLNLSESISMLLFIQNNNPVESYPYI